MVKPGKLNARGMNTVDVNPRRVGVISRGVMDGVGITIRKAWTGLNREKDYADEWRYLS